MSALTFVVMVTVPNVVLPPKTVEGAIDRVFNASPGVSVKFADTETPALVAVTVRTATAETAEVVTLKLIEGEPGGTVTLGGTVMTELFELRATLTPPAGAGAFIVTVPNVPMPPTTVEGLKASAVGTIGLIVICAVATELERPSREALYVKLSLP